MYMIVYRDNHYVIKENEKIEIGRSPKKINSIPGIYMNPDCLQIQRRHCVVFIKNGDLYISHAGGRSIYFYITQKNEHKNTKNEIKYNNVKNEKVQIKIDKNEIIKVICVEECVARERGKNKKIKDYMYFTIELEKSLNCLENKNMVTVLCDVCDNKSQLCWLCKSNGNYIKYGPGINVKTNST